MDLLRQPLQGLPIFYTNLYTSLPVLSLLNNAINGIIKMKRFIFIMPIYLLITLTGILSNDVAMDITKFL